MPNLICEPIIGDDLLQQHKSVTFKFRGKLPQLVVATIMCVANIPYSQLFDDNLSARCKPIAIKTRKFSSADIAVIKVKTTRLLQEDRIESSNSLGGHSLLWSTMERRSECALTTDKPSIYLRI